MLKSKKNIKTLLAIVTGVLALGISIPTSGNISLTAPAMANMGGGGGGDGGSIEALMERMGNRNLSRRGRFSSGTRNVFRARRTSWKVFPGYKPKRSAAQRRNVKLRNARRRAERRARIARAEENAALRRGPRAYRRYNEAVARRAAREARRQRRAAERAARRQAVADRMRARRQAEAIARNARRMFGMDFNNDSMSSTDREGNTTTVRTDRFGQRFTTITPANANPVPVAAPVPAPVPAPNVPWASSTNRVTGITTTSVGMPNGNHAVTLTNAQGTVVNSFVVQR